MSTLSCRSAIYYYDKKQHEAAEKTKAVYQKALAGVGDAKVYTEILPIEEFYYAEDYHQQYLHKNPDGHCGLNGCGVKLPGN